MSGASTNGSSANGASGSEQAPPPEAKPERLRLGGMALRNGLLIHGPSSWAVAARAGDGSIEVASGPKPTLARGRLASTPLVRGPLRLAEAMAVLPLARLRLRSARLPFEDPSVIAVAAASVVGSNLLRRRGPATVGRELAIAADRGAAGARRLAGPSARLLSRRRAQGDRRLRAGPRPRGSAQGARALRLEPDRPDARPLDRRPGADRALHRRAGAAGARDRSARRASAAPSSCSCSPSAIPTRRSDARSTGRATRSSGCVSTREPTAEQLEVGVAALQEVLRVERQAADTV